MALLLKDLLKQALTDSLSLDTQLVVRTPNRDVFGVVEMHTEDVGGEKMLILRTPTR